VLETLTSPDGNRCREWKSKVMRIHFGAFNCPIEGWLNTDITPHLYLARAPLLPWILHKAGKIPPERYRDYQSGAFRKLKYLNVAKDWPFNDDTAEAIFSSHVFEHLPLHGARVCLKNAYRVLRRGGVVRIVVPNLDQCIANYSAQTAFEWACEVFEADHASGKNMHHFMYNPASMTRMMREAGFSDIQQRSYGVGRCPDIKQLDNRPESLFMEAVK
jgi:hypothetical protein